MVAATPANPPSRIPGRRAVANESTTSGSVISGPYSVWRGNGIPYSKYGEQYPTPDTRTHTNATADEAES